MEGPSTSLEYLGILLDSASLEALLPPDKLQDIHSALNQWMARQQSSKQELLSLIGTLSFAAKVVPAGRTFLRRMIDLSTTADTLQETITLSEEFRLDLHWWRTFATPWDGRSFFLLPEWTPRPQPLHRQLWYYWLWSILPGPLVQWKVDPRPAPPQHPVEGTVPYSLRSLCMGPPLQLCDNQAVVRCIVSGTSSICFVTSSS